MTTKIPAAEQAKGDELILPPLPERDGDWAGDDWFTANSMRDYARAAYAIGRGSAVRDYVILNDATLAQPAPVSGAQELTLALPDYEKRKIVIVSDEIIDGERLVCIAIKDAPVSSAVAEQVGGIGRFRDSAEYKSIRQASGSAQQDSKPVALEVRYLLKNCLPSLARCGQKSLIHEINEFLAAPAAQEAPAYAPKFDRAEFDALAEKGTKALGQDANGQDIEAAEKQAALYEGDDRKDIKIDVMNSFYAGIRYARQASPGVIEKTGTLICPKCGVDPVRGKTVLQGGEDVNALQVPASVSTGKPAG
jgi:hypothetical protein